MIRTHPSGLRLCFFLAAFAGAGVAAGSALAFRAAGRRFHAASRYSALCPLRGRSEPPSSCNRLPRRDRR
jgi:hypothetical protein